LVVRTETAKYMFRRRRAYFFPFDLLKTFPS
jgi:hypothetical protein